VHLILPNERTLPLRVAASVTLLGTVRVHVAAALVTAPTTVQRTAPMATLVTAMASRLVPFSVTLAPAVHSADDGVNDSTCACSRQLTETYIHAPRASVHD
jgi:hypothetical protein